MRRKRSANNHGRTYHLKYLDHDTPFSVFQNTFFPLKIALMDTHDRVVALRAVLQVDLLYHEDGQLASKTKLKPDADVLEVQLLGSKSSELFVDDTSGVCDAVARLKQLTFDGNMPYCLKISAPNNPNIEDCISPPIRVVKYKLQLSDTVPSIWYKDQGGRDKAILATVTLVDSSGQRVTDRSLDLKCVLKYHNETLQNVKDQSILKVNHARIDNRGQATLRVRIEEVSKNHQKQDFVIWVGPNDMSTHSDVAPVVSTHITVRSKVNPKTATKTKKRRATEVPTAVPVPPLQMHKPNPVKPPALSSEEQARLKEGNTEFGASVLTMTSWISVVVEGMASMEWQHVGYEVNQNDGSLNLNRPLFRCPYCWTYKDMLRPAKHTVDCAIDKSISMYETKVKSALTKLVQICDEQTVKQMNERGAPVPIDIVQQQQYHQQQVHQQALPSTSPSPPESPGTHQQLMMAGSRLEPHFLVRGMSAELGIGRLQEQVSNDFLSLDMMPTAEQVVYSIFLKDTTIGFPAFDMMNSLIGYYVYEPMVKVLIWTPRSKYSGNVEEEKLAEQMTAQFLEAMNDPRSGEVMTLNTFVTLDKLKEQVVLQHQYNTSRPIY